MRLLITWIFVDSNTFSWQWVIPLQLEEADLSGLQHLRQSCYSPPYPELRKKSWRIKNWCYFSTTLLEPNLVGSAKNQPQGGEEPTLSSTGSGVKSVTKWKMRSMTNPVTLGADTLPHHQDVLHCLRILLKILSVQWIPFYWNIKRTMFWTIWCYCLNL